MIELNKNHLNLVRRTLQCKWFCISVLFLVLPAKSTELVHPASTESIGVLCKAICEYVQEQTPDDEQIEVEISSAPKNVIAGLQAPIKISCKRRGVISGRTIFTISSQNAEGLWSSFQVLADVRRFREVLVLSSDKDRNDLISEGDLSVERREVVWPNTEIPVTLGEAVGKRTKRWIAKGRVLTQSMLEEMPVIKRGSAVNIEVNTKNLYITFPAIACEDGLLGEKIRVKNKASGVFYRAEVKDAQTVIYKY